MRVITPYLQLVFPGPPCVLPEFQYTYISISLSSDPSIQSSIHPSAPKLLAEIRKQESQKSCGMVKPHCEVASLLGLGKNDISSLRKKSAIAPEEMPSQIGNDRLPTIHFRVRTVRFGDDSWKTTSGFLLGPFFM